MNKKTTLIGMCVLLVILFSNSVFGELDNLSIGKAVSVEAGVVEAFWGGIGAFNDGQVALRTTAYATAMSPFATTGEGDFTGANPPTIVIDLNASYFVYDVNFYHMIQAGNNHIDKYNINYSLDNSSWSTLVKDGVNDTDYATHTLNDNARYIRFEALSSSLSNGADGYAGIVELLVSGETTGIFFTAPTPPNGATNNTQVTINLTCASGNVNLWFDSMNPPETKVIDNQPSPATYTTAVGTEGTYYYIGGCGAVNVSVREWSYDASAPTITINPNNYFNSTNGTLNPQSEILNFNYTAQDNLDLFGTYINVSLDGALLFNYTDSSLSGTSQEIRVNTSMDGWANGEYDVVIQISDSHTANNIGDYEYSWSQTELNFDTPEGNNIIIRSLRNADWGVIRKPDRYSFAFEPHELDAENKYKFQIYCDNGLVYRENSRYKGHFVCSKDGITGNWIDFEAGGAPVKVTEEGDGWYEVEVEFEESSIIFDSIGGLNILEQHYQFDLQRYKVNDCENGTPTLYFQTFDEDNPTDLLNTTMELELTFLAENYTYNLEYELGNNHTVCLFPNDSIVRADAYAKYTTPNGYTHRWYLINRSLSSTPYVVNMYNFNVTTGKSDLKLTIRRNDNYKYFENIITQLQRKYVAEGVWRTVQMDESGDFGLVFFNIIEENTDYRLIYSDRNNNILKTTESLKFICTAGVCELTQQLDPYSASASSDIPTITTLFDNSTGHLNVSWVAVSGNSVSMAARVTRETLTGTTEVCDLSGSGSEGTLSCPTQPYTGTFQLDVTVGEEPQQTEFFQSDEETLSDFISIAESAIWTFIIMVAIIMFGLFSPVGVVIATVLGIILIYFLGIMAPITIGFVAVSTVIGIAIAIKVKT